MHRIARVKFLIIGGTIFLGRHLVDAAIARDHEVTLFNRGRHGADLYPQVEKLRGDRRSDVSSLEGRHWDAVIDTSGYVPDAVRPVMAALDRDRTAHYTFVSSVSVYAAFTQAGVDEEAPVATIAAEELAMAEEMDSGDRPTARTYGAMYGALKVLCERAAEEAMPGRVLNVRPGLVVGPHDYTDRFTYWVRRMARGGTVLAPGRPERRVRVVDARDLARWIVEMAESRQTGLFNASGAEDGLNMGRMLETCREVSHSDASLLWADDGFLLEQEVKPWSELPLWLPAAHNGLFEVRNDKAIAAGLTFRPLATTIDDTLQWDRTRPQDEPLRAGLTPQRERQLLRVMN